MVGVVLKRWRIRRWVWLLVLSTFVAIWIGKGAHRGYTRDSEFVSTPDPVTGTTKVDVVRVWTPGIDFLAIGVLASATVWFALRRTKDSQ